MNKKILASIFVIGILALAMGWGTYSFFSDTEKSTGNVFTAGTIDIAVDNQNPWTATYSAALSDVKPSENRWITFVITNPGKNPVDVWKRIVVKGCDGGSYAYWGDAARGASSEPEYTEGGGQFDANGIPTGNGYVERCNLAPYIIYDLKIPGVRWIVKPEQQIRIDNIDGFWIYLGEIDAGSKMTVEQSYHLSSWQDAPILDVTNWAQGDTMKFDIELYAEQVSGVGPIGAEDTLKLVKKDPVTWVPSEDAGHLKYKTAANEFTYTFDATGLTAITQYSLIYYADPWPGDGTDHSTGALIGTFTSDINGAIVSTPGNVNLGTDLPNSKDKNFGVGAKIWLVLSSDYSTTTLGAQGHMTAWNPSGYLFETHLINYHDTGP